MRFYTLLALLLMAGGAKLQAQITCWDGTVAETFAGGDGTFGNPYQIATANQLALMAYQTNNGTGGNACYLLTDTICLNGSEGQEWQPIGTEEFPFTGHFDGNQFTIRDMFVTNVDFSGLFGITQNATVCNLRMTDAMMDNYINPQGADGLVVGKATNTNIVNCTSNGLMYCIASKQGGIVGHYVVDTIGADTISIKDCVNYVSISGMLYTGGIAGYTEILSGNMSIQHCVNLGNISDATMCGGIVGAGSFSIQDCENYGNISSYSIAGGMVGQMDDFGEIVFCINHDKATVEGEIAGGIIGTAMQSKIAMCANRAKVTASGSTHDLICAGGIAGADGAISNCYNCGDVQCIVLSGQPEVVQMGGITGTGGSTGYIRNVYNAGAIIPPANPHTNNAWYGIIAAGMSNSSNIRNWYWFGEYDVNPYGFDWPSFSVPGSCAFNEGATATTWILDAAQYGTTDLTEALNQGAMNECSWMEDENMTNGGFPIFGPAPTWGLAEQVMPSFNVYPNPTNGVLFVTIQSVISQPQAYRITNLMGQTMQSGNLMGDNQQLDVSALPAGMYLLTVDGATMKFVVR